MRKQEIIFIRFPMQLVHTVRNFGYGVVRDLVGHGVGCELHEDPQIRILLRKGRGIRLRPGMTLAIEPMVMQVVMMWSGPTTTGQLSQKMVLFQLIMRIQF